VRSATKSSRCQCLGVTMHPHQAPHRDVWQDRRIGTRVPVEVDVGPTSRPGLPRSGLRPAGTAPHTRKAVRSRPRAAVSKRPVWLPVPHRLGDGAPRVSQPDPGIQVAVQRGELTRDLLLGAAGHLTPDPSAVPLVLERDHSAPSPGPPLWCRTSRQSPEWSK
jgi:hypothetical protein